MSDYVMVPYTTVDGVPTFKDSEIASWYYKIIEQGLRDDFFFDGSVDSEDVFVSNVKRKDRAIYVFLSGNSVVGIYWLTHIEKTSAYGHFLCFKEIWGTSGVDSISKKFLSVCFDDINLSVLIGLTPSRNVHVVRMTQRVGLKKVGVIPNLFWDAKCGKPIDGTVLCITKEEFENESLQASNH